MRIKQGQPETSRRHSSRKSWSQYSRQHRSAKAKAIGKGSKVALSFLESEGFKAKSITLKELETRQTRVGPRKWQVLAVLVLCMMQVMRTLHTSLSTSRNVFVFQMKHTMS